MTRRASYARRTRRLPSERRTHVVCDVLESVAFPAGKPPYGVGRPAYDALVVRSGASIRGPGDRELPPGAGGERVATTTFLNALGFSTATSQSRAKSLGRSPSGGGAPPEPSRRSDGPWGDWRDIPRSGPEAGPRAEARSAETRLAPTNLLLLADFLNLNLWLDPV